MLSKRYVVSETEISKITTQMKQTTRRLGEAPLGRLLIKLSLPSMVSMIMLALYNLADTFWVAKLGYHAIAALTVFFPFHILTVAIGVGTGIGVNSLTSRRFGEKNIEVTNRVAGQVFPIVGFLGLIFLAAAIFFPRPILTISGATPDIMDYAVQYMTIIGYGLPFFFFQIIGSSLLRGSGEAVKPMVFMITAIVTNIILDPFFIFGIGPFPEMGIRGAAVATVIAQTLGALLIFYYVISRKSAYRIKPHHLRPSMLIIYDIYHVGLPSMAIEITSSIMFAVFNSALSEFGAIYLAAGGIIIRIIDLAFMPTFGACAGLLPVIGFNYGARLWKRLWRAVRLASTGLALLLGAFTVILEILAPNLIGIFSKDPELQAIATPAMRILLSTLILIGPTILFITAFQGLAKGKEALILSLARQVVFFIPMLILLSKVLGVTGIWLAIPISDVLGFLVTGAWLLREYGIQQKYMKLDATGQQAEIV